MSVIGSISIKDNATSVMKNIRTEQSAFRKDVEKTKKELKSTWDKQYKAKLESSTAVKKAKELKGKLEPLRKKIVTAVAVKDMATDKIRSVTKKIKNAGKMVAKPVVNVVVKGTQALAGIGKGIASAAKAAGIGIAAVGAAGAAALKAIYNGSEEAAKAQIEAETKLEAVLGNVSSIQARGAGAAKAAKQELMGVASELQKVGVIGDEVTLAGMQQLATFQLSEKEITTLSAGMTDLLAQQKGLNATQEDAVGIANMIGKAMQGQSGALSKVGITFDEAQKKALETGNAEQRAAVLAEILQQNVGGVNKALAETDQGKIQQVANAYGDMKEEVGKLSLSLKAKLASVVMNNLPTIQKLGTTMVSTISKFADKAIPVIDGILSKAMPVIESVLSKIGKLAEGLTPVVSRVFRGLKGSAAAAKPFISDILRGFQKIEPQLSSFATTVFSTVRQIASAAMPVISSIIRTIQDVLPAVIPVLENVVSTVGSVLSAAAPVISGLVEGIGVVVSELAPVFSKIFSEIGEKVGSVLSFVGERMGFIQEAIGAAAPLISDILSTAWGVISPILDIAINIFKILFSVVQKVFPGIQKILQTVWKVVKPIVEGIGKVVGKISSWFGNVADAITGSGKSEDKVGKNASGDNNWRGGLTWVGEKGPELVELPKGSRILPNKESISVTSQIPKSPGVVKKAAKKQTQAVMPSAVPKTKEDSFTGIITELIREILDKIKERRDEKRSADEKKTDDKKASGARIIIQKLADEIVVRDEDDVDELAEKIAKKFLEVILNMN